MSTNRILKIIFFNLMSLLLMTTQAKASPLIKQTIKLNIDNISLSMICNPLKLYDDVSEMIIVNDERDINLTSEFKRENGLENPDILECHYGKAKAVVFRNYSNKSKTTNFDIIARINDKTYGNKIDSLTKEIDLNLIPDTSEITSEHSCSHGEEVDYKIASDYNHQPNNQNQGNTLVDCLESAETPREINQCIERFENEIADDLNRDFDGVNHPADRYGPIEDQGSPINYVIYMDIITDQYFLRDRTDHHLPANMRFRQIKEQIERYMVLTNLFMNSELDLTLKVKRLYTYFGNSKFVTAHTGGSDPLGHSIFDDMEDFFDDRPTDDRAFAFLASTVNRENMVGDSNGGSNSFTEKMCDPGYTWAHVPEVPNDADLDLNEFYRNFANITPNNVLFHEFAHQMHQRHNYDYGNNFANQRDCCQLANELHIPIPADRIEDYVLNAHDEARLRSCMNRNFSGRNFDWLNEEDTSDEILLDSVYFGTIMSSGDFLGESSCVNKRSTYSNRTRTAIQGQLNSLHRGGIRIDGDGDICVHNQANQAPIINDISVENIAPNRFIIRIDASDNDQELMQARGPNREVLFDPILIYEVFKSKTSLEMIISNENEIEVEIENGIEEVTVRVYDDKGAYVRKNVILIPDDFFEVNIENNNIPLDSETEITVTFNIGIFQINEIGHEILPNSSPIDIIFDFYGDGSEIEERSYTNLRDLYNFGRRQIYRPIYRRAGNFQPKVTARIKDSEKIILTPINVESNFTPEVESVEIINFRSESGSGILNPGVPLNFDFHIFDENIYQDINAFIDFGDGTSENYVVMNAFLREERIYNTIHTYREPGVYAINLTLNDGRGGITRFTHTIEVKVELEQMEHELPRGITPTEESVFILRANAYHYQGNLVFNVDFGNGILEERIVTSEQAREGVRFTQTYASMRAGSLLAFRLSVRANGLTHNPIEETYLLRVRNVAPEITEARYYTPFTDLEMLQEMNRDDRERWIRNNPERFSEMQNSAQTQSQVATFKVRFNDLNGIRDRFDINWRFSNGGQPISLRFLDHGYFETQHQFDSMENAWAEVTVCDIQGDCDTRRIDLNSANRERPLENINEELEQNSPNGPNLDNPFGR